MLRPCRRTLCLLALAACDGPAGTKPPGTDDSATDATCGVWSYDEAPLEWALPSTLPIGAAASWDRSEAACDEDLPIVATFDLTGDGYVDLVQLSDCDDDAVGRAGWWVYPGSAAGFGAAIDWTLPAGFANAAFSATSRAAAVCDSGDSPAFFLADMDGVPGEDLVVTESCVDGSLAEGAWRVYANVGSGFADAQVRTLPVGYSVGAFVTPSSETTCSGLLNLPAWGITDLDGDSRADLVLTGNCVDADVGSTTWNVYLNDGAAFATTTADWSVPLALSPGALERSVPLCNAGKPAYFLLDLDGSGRPSLVVPSPCSGDIGDWQTFTNRGDGFSTVETLLVGPWGFGASVTAAERTAAACDQSLSAYALADADHDGQADLTVTDLCADDSVGDARWVLYPRTDDGWVESATIELPTGYSAGAFTGGENDVLSCGGTGNHPAWTRMDVDGDGVAEIVVTEACDDATVGTSAWRVYTSTCTE